MSPDNRQSALTPALYIVQADSLNTADKSVVRVDAKVEQEFEIIHSVSAYLTPKQVATLRDTSLVIAPAVSTVLTNTRELDDPAITPLRAC